MKAVEGQFYDGTASRPWAARLVLAPGPVVEVEDGRRLPLDLARCRISEPLGRLPRKIEMDAGASFVSTDNDGLDRLLRGDSGRRGFSLHRLESSWLYTLAGLVLVVLVGWWVFVDGIPRLSRSVAVHLPDGLYTSLSEQTLDILREQLLSDSRLPAERRDGLHQAFDAMVAKLDWRHGFELLNHGTQDGDMANAFALPDGTVILTDGLVERAASDDEILAVLAHEAGHVVMRHGMQRLVHDSMLVFLITMITGDTSGLSAAGLGLPALLLGLDYSRESERQADEFAVHLLAGQGKDPQLLADMLEKLDGRAEGSGHADAARWSNYLSTHPATRERIDSIRRQAASLGY